jgi:hypothetical protein
MRRGEYCEIVGLVAEVTRREAEEDWGAEIP